jgi:hypothetical protein
MATAQQRRRPQPWMNSSAPTAPHHPRDPIEYTELLCRLHPVGTPEHCLDKLRTTAQRTGIGHLILLVEGTGDRARTLENITRLGAEVLPSLRDRTQPQPVRHSRSVH